MVLHVKWVRFNDLVTSLHGNIQDIFPVSTYCWGFKMVVHENMGSTSLKCVRFDHGGVDVKTVIPMGGKEWFRLCAQGS